MSLTPHPLQIAQAVEALQPNLPLQPITEYVFRVFQPFPYLGTLLILMAMDILTGLLCAWVNKLVSSSVSYKGLTRKACMWLIVGLAIAIQRETPGVPLARMVAFFYIANEGLSILENAGKLGVPLPQGLIDVLVKVRKGTSSDTQPLVIEKKETVYIAPPSPPQSPKSPDDDPHK